MLAIHYLWFIRECGMINECTVFFNVNNKLVHVKFVLIFLVGSQETAY